MLQLLLDNVMIIVLIVLDHLVFVEQLQNKVVLINKHVKIQVQVLVIV